MKSNSVSRKTMVQEMLSLCSGYVGGKRSIEMPFDLHIAFIDYEREFDRVKHEILMKDLKMLGIDEKDLRLLNNLYKEQLAAISINGKLSNWAHINRGVCQECALSPDLFLLYAEKIIRKIVSTEDIKINALQSVTSDMLMIQC